MLDAGHPGAEVVELAQPAFDQAEAEGDERAEAELYRVVGRAWRAAQHPDDVDELVAIRELARTEPGSVVARVTDAALARRLADDPLPEHRLDAFRQLAAAGRMLDRIEGWGGMPRKRGTPGVLARL
jgi:hypothetical protein